MLTALNKRRLPPRPCEPADSALRHAPLRHHFIGGTLSASRHALCLCGACLQIHVDLKDAAITSGARHAFIVVCVGLPLIAPPPISCGLFVFLFMMQSVSLLL